MVTLWYRPPEILLGKKRYSGSADIWGIGCILAEIATKLPLFAGDSEIDQLFQIYRILGTPNPKTWPGIEQLPDYHTRGPKWRKKDLAKELNYRLDMDGIDLLQKTLIYAPNQRITAKKMLLHRWFDEIREEMKAKFGNGFPHCGSPEYQREHRRNKERENENKGNEEEDGDQEIVVDEDEDCDESEEDTDQDDDEDEEEDTDSDEDEDEDMESNEEDDDDDDMEQEANGRRNTRSRRR